MSFSQSVYKKALSFAAMKHKNQKLPGTSMPYLVHVVEVAMEVTVAGFETKDFDTSFAVVVALLHDSMEDTDTSYQEVKKEFNEETADGVLALTKFSNLEKEEQINNSLDRIKELKKEVWAVKLADRITNLTAPPLDWDFKKRKHYMESSLTILDELAEANPYLSFRLKEKIDQYANYVITGEKNQV